MARNIRIFSFNPVISKADAVAIKLDIDPHYQQAAGELVHNRKAEPHVLRNVLDWQKRNSLRR